MPDDEDIAAQEREFEELIRTRRIRPSGMPISAMSDLGFPVLCSATRSDGDPCYWPPVDATDRCAVHVGQDYREWQARAAEANLSTWMSLGKLVESGATELVKLVTWSVVLLHLRRRGVDVDGLEHHERRDAGAANDRAYAGKMVEVEASVTELESIMEQALGSAQGDSIDKLPPLASRAVHSMLTRVEISRTSFGDTFRRYVDREITWDAWKFEVIKELANRTAQIYLDSIYRMALHAELGWEPDSGTTPAAINGARRSLDLLQRITSYSRRGPKAESAEEARRRVQDAIDRVRERGEKLDRYSIAAELAVSPSGLDDLLRRHKLRRTKAGRVELSANI